MQLDPCRCRVSRAVAGDDRQPATGLCRRAGATGGQFGLLGNRSVMDTPFNQTSFTTRVQDQQAQTVSDVLVDDPSVRRSGAGLGLSPATTRRIRGFHVDPPPKCLRRSVRHPALPPRCRRARGTDRGAEEERAPCSTQRAAANRRHDQSRAQARTRHSADPQQRLLFGRAVRRAHQRRTALRRRQANRRALQRCLQRRSHRRGVQHRRAPRRRSASISAASACASPPILVIRTSISTALSLDAGSQMASRSPPRPTANQHNQPWAYIERKDALRRRGAEVDLTEMSRLRDLRRARLS